MKTVKHIGENIGGNLRDLGLGENLLRYDAQSPDNKRKR